VSTTIAPSPDHAVLEVFRDSRGASPEDLTQTARAGLIAAGVWAGREGSLAC